MIQFQQTSAAETKPDDLTELIKQHQAKKAALESKSPVLTFALLALAVLAISGVVGFFVIGYTKSFSAPDFFARVAAFSIAGLLAAIQTAFIGALAWSIFSAGREGKESRTRVKPKRGEA